MAAAAGAGKKKPGKLDPEALAKQEEKAKKVVLLLERNRLTQSIQAEEAQHRALQVERDKLNHFWLGEKKRLEDVKDTLRDRERELQDLEEQHQVEIKLLKQRVKHLLFEHQSETTSAKMEGVVSLKLAQDEHRESESELRGDVRALERRLREMEAEHEAYLRELAREQDRAMTQLRFDFERETRELATQYEDLMESTRRTLFKRREEDLSRLETRKARQAEEYAAAHQRAFEEVRRYYAEITQSNLDLIKTLKEEVAELARKDAADERRVVAIAQENKRMSAPLARRLEESRRLRAEKEAYLADLELLKRRKAKLLETESRLNSLLWETDLLQQRLQRLEGERDDLRSRFVEALHDVQQKAGFRGVLLERKLDVAAREVEKKGAQVAEVLSEARIGDPLASHASIERTADEVVAAKDRAIGVLEAELRRNVDAHNRLVARMAERLAAHGIRPEDLGFEPIAETDLLPPPPELAAAAPDAAARGGGGAAATLAASVRPLPAETTDARVLRGGPLAAHAAAALRTS